MERLKDLWNKNADEDRLASCISRQRLACAAISANRKHLLREQSDESMQARQRLQMKPTKEGAMSGIHSTIQGLRPTLPNLFKVGFKLEGGRGEWRLWKP